MRLPTSSSLILATLAISSSSTSLAAPTGDGSTESRMVASQSNSRIHGNDDADVGKVERALGDLELEARGNGMVSDILAGLPIVGPLAKALLVKDCPPPDGASTQSTDDVSQEDLARLQSAVDTVSSALSGILPSGAPIPLPTGAAGGVASMVPAPLPSPIAGIAEEGGTDSQDHPTDSASIDNPPNPTGGAAAAADSPETGSSFLISPTTTLANAEEANETATPTNAESLSSAGALGATPTSPGVPAGPPNTPAMPETTGVDDTEPDQEAK